MSPSHDVAPAWRKSDRSATQGECVEIAAIAEKVAVRDSKNPSGSMLTFATEEWRTFARHVKAGQFDL